MIDIDDMPEPKPDPRKPIVIHFRAKPSITAAEAEQSRQLLDAMERGLREKIEQMEREETNRKHAQMPPDILAKVREIRDAAMRLDLLP